MCCLWIVRLKIKKYINFEKNVCLPPSWLSRYVWCNGDIYYLQCDRIFLFSFFKTVTKQYLFVLISSVKYHFFFKRRLSHCILLYGYGKYYSRFHNLNLFCVHRSRRNLTQFIIRNVVDNVVCVCGGGCMCERVIYEYIKKHIDLQREFFHVHVQYAIHCDGIRNCRGDDSRVKLESPKAPRSEHGPTRRIPPSRTSVTPTRERST